MSVHKKILNRKQVPSAGEQVESEVEQSNESTPAPKETQPLFSNSIGTNQVKPGEVKKVEESQSQEDDELDIDWEKLKEMNSSKTNIRSTSDVFPSDLRTLNSLQMPTSLIIKPFGSKEENVAVTSFGNNSILRCENCRAYVGPFCTFSRQGKEMTCGICGDSQDLPNYYVSPLNDQGDRLDKYDRPQLCCGTYDIKAGQDYMSRAPVAPTYFFLMDVSQAAVQSGYLKLAVSQIQQAIEQNKFEGGERTMFGIITFDEHIHIYNLNSQLKQPQMITLTDPKDPDIPIPDDLVVNIQESQENILALLDSMLQMFGSTTQKESCFTFALDLAFSQSKHLGGRLFIFLASTQIIHEPAFEDKTLKANTKELKEKLSNPANLVLPTSPHFRNIAAEMHPYFIKPSIFVIGNCFQNVVTLQQLARHLEGQINVYPTNYQQGEMSFYYDFKCSLQKHIAWEAVFRIRVSTGWKFMSSYANYTVQQNDLLCYQTDEDSVIVYDLTIPNSTSTIDAFAVQTALLYTSGVGQRRLRIHNYYIPTTQDVKKIYESVDSNALSFVYLRHSLSRMYYTPLHTVRTEMMNNFQRLISNVSKIYQNIFPESMVSLPLMMLGLIQMQVFNHHYKRELSSDFVNALRIQLNSIGVDEAMLYYVPYLFDLSAFCENEANCNVDEFGSFTYPPLSSLNFESIQSSQAFLMDAGDIIYLFFNASVAPESTLVDDIISLQIYHSNHQLNEDHLYTNSTNPVNTKLYNLLKELRSRQQNQYAPLYILRATQSERNHLDKFYQYFVENKYTASQIVENYDYNTFLAILMTPPVSTL